MNATKIEIFEEGQQIRRSSKSVRSNIVEGYGRRNYKNEYIRFLIFSIASNDETRDHLEMLFETKSLTDEIVFKSISEKIDKLGIKLYYFLKSVEEKHMSSK
ncbi:MAG TPA: four helix bundle protein [Chitinophagaceae bacterium]|nr:four helix bundle protein [Chitinophagaceae bacterium]